MTVESDAGVEDHGDAFAIEETRIGVVVGRGAEDLSIYFFLLTVPVPLFLLKLAEDVDAVDTWPFLGVFAEDGVLNLAREATVDSV